MPDMSISITRH